MNDEITSLAGMVILDQILFAEASDAYDQVKELEHSLEIYEAISDTITKCGGVTKSLEVMFGENFSSAASMEAEALDKAKEICRKVIEKLKDFFSKIWDWFKRIFMSNKRLIDNLHKAEDNADKIKFPIKVKLAAHFDDLNDWVEKMKSFCQTIESFNPETEDPKTLPNIEALKDVVDIKEFEESTIDSADAYKQACVSATNLMNSVNELFEKLDASKNKINSLINAAMSGNEVRKIVARRLLLAYIAKLHSKASKFANKVSRAVAFELLQPKTDKDNENNKTEEQTNK